MDIVSEQEEPPLDQAPTVPSEVVIESRVAVEHEDTSPPEAVSAQNDIKDPDQQPEADRLGSEEDARGGAGPEAFLVDEEKSESEGFASPQRS